VKFKRGLQIIYCLDNRIDGRGIRLVNIYSVVILMREKESTDVWKGCHCNQLRVVCPPRVPFQRRGRVAFLVPHAIARAKCGIRVGTRLRWI
jgi:hypothetical protein